MKHLDHEIKCPCGRVLMTIHAGDVPAVRQAAARVRLVRIVKAIKAHGKKPPRGKDLGRLRARAEPAAEDLGPELAAFWALRAARDIADPYVHYCACGAVVRHETDGPGAAPRGHAVGRHHREPIRPGERRRPRRAPGRPSDPGDTPPS